MVEDEILPALEAILFSAGKPLTLVHIQGLLTTTKWQVSNQELKVLLERLGQGFAARGIELVEVASGYRLQVKMEFASIVAKLWEEKPQRYSRALLETLALIIYRQPITRGEIEEIRGVSISASIFKVLVEERNWAKVIGHREVPGRPALYATTKEFLDYFGFKSIEDLPPLTEIFTAESVKEELVVEEP